MTNASSLICCAVALTSAWIAQAVAADPLTLPVEKRPEWLRRDGIVMAGSWEPLLCRARLNGAKDYMPTPQQRAGYEREHTPEMIASLKALGVNFVMMHCFRGVGLQAEHESMADAARFAKLCHAKWFARRRLCRQRHAVLGVDV